MKFNTRRVAKVVSTAAVVAATMSIGGASPAAAGSAVSFHGVFAETSAGSSAGYDLHGSAKMTIGPSGTVVRVNVSGLDPHKVYGSHLHNGTCASGGGGHYQDVEGGATVPPNELWLSSGGVGLAPNPGGVAHGAGSAVWQARVASAATNARSVVVHEPGSGTRIACADLS
jgi:hypothetical protein